MIHDDSQRETGFGNQRQKVLVICGPTASGKSATAIEIAKMINGEIISADSMQIYRGLDIGTAKVTEAEQQGVPHHLIDCCDPGEFFSVASYKRLALEMIESILQRGKVPIVCGGTGQYISALVEGIEFVDLPTDPELRQRLSHRADEAGLAVLYQELRRLDPETADRVKPQDRKRIIRALEIYEQSGIKPSEHLSASRHGPAYDYQIYVLSHDRPVLYQRINERVEAMFEAGLVEEVRKLLEIRPDMLKTTSSSSTGPRHLIDPAQSAKPAGQGAWQAIGYKEILSLLAGQQSEVEAKAQIAQSSRRYAKRQLTWFRRIPDATWFYNLNPHDAAVRITEAWLKTT